MDNWEEVKTAFHVARLGTVSAAAEIMGVHHATVIRHVDALEKDLGVKLFQRHARGYTPTEAGKDLLVIAQRTEEQFRLLASRIRGQGDSVSGELVITAIGGFEALILPALAKLQQEHVDLSLQFLTDTRLFRLDIGEAHLAIRAGAQPKEPEYVVQLFATLANGLYASQSYVDRHGKPESIADMAQHRFVGAAGDQNRAPFQRWLNDTVPKQNITFRTSDVASYRLAIEQGMGLGFVPTCLLNPEEPLVQILPPVPEWEVPLWIVTHMDLHRTAKVQTVANALKQQAKTWHRP